MATVNSYLRSLIKDIKKSKTSKSTYYTLDKKHIIRVSDHISTTYAQNYFIQIVTPFNKSRTYIAVYENNVMQFNFAELKTFLQTMFMLAHEEEVETKLKKNWENTLHFVEISGSPDEVLEQIKEVYECLPITAQKRFRKLLKISNINDLKKEKLIPFLQSKPGKIFFQTRKIKINVWNWMFF